MDSGQILFPRETSEVLIDLKFYGRFAKLIITWSINKRYWRTMVNAIYQSPSFQILELHGESLLLNFRRKLFESFWLAWKYNTFNSALKNTHYKINLEAWTYNQNLFKKSRNVSKSSSSPPCTWRPQPCWRPWFDLVRSRRLNLEVLQRCWFPRNHETWERWDSKWLPKP